MQSIPDQSIRLEKVHSVAPNVIGAEKAQKARKVQEIPISDRGQIKDMGGSVFLPLL